MVTPKGVLIGVSTALVLLGWPEPSRAQGATSAVPRYRWEPGQELTYHATSEFKYENGSHGTRTDWKVWVVRKNDDGSSRIVLRSSQTFSQSSGGRPRTEGPARVTLAYCDVFPDGRIVPNDSLGFHLDPTVILPRLPGTTEQIKRGWEGEGVRDDSRTEYRPAPDAEADSETWVFSGDRHSAMDKVYESSSGSRFFFDRKKAVLGRVESQSTQGYGFHGKGTGTAELVSVERHDGDWTRTFAQEADRYFAANKAYEDLTTRASKDAARVESLLADAEQVLKDVRERLSLPILREQVDERLKTHKGLISYYTEEAKNRARILGHEAADWETKDIEGNTHSLKGYRGKVVILDFWYRGCGWCIRAMPQMVQLADDFKDQPVAVLGMNTDRKEEDAKFVVDAMKLNYPALKAEGLPEKYRVRGFPTLIIIDQEGKVADIHVGYSPTLRDEVAKTVKQLLARK